MKSSGTVRPLVFALLLIPTFAHAQAVVSAVLDATGVPDASVKRAQRATESALKQLSALSVGEGPAFKKGAPRKCAGEDCARELVQSLSAAGAVLLDLKAADSKGERVSVELQLWLDGERIGTRRGEGSIDGFEAAVKPVLEALVPPWAKKGFGGLRLQVEPGATVKIDGRISNAKPGEVLALAAGTHQVDVVFPDGHAVLQRLDVAEGARGRVEVDSPAEAVSGSAPKSMSALRGVSYGLWVAGAATIAGGLIAGALGRGTAAGLSPCVGDSRDCATLDTVLQRNSAAESYANTGNILLGVGGGLAAAGAGLFVIDLVSQ